MNDAVMKPDHDTACFLAYVDCRAAFADLLAELRHVKVEGCPIRESATDFAAAPVLSNPPYTVPPSDRADR